MISGTWYQVVFFPVTQQHTATATCTVDAHHHLHHQRQASAGDGAQLVVVVLVLVLDLRKGIVEVSGTCYLVCDGIRVVSERG